MTIWLVLLKQLIMRRRLKMSKTKDAVIDDMNTAGTMQEGYEKQQTQKTIQEKVVELLAVVLDAVYNSSYEDEVKQKTLGLISRALIPIRGPRNVIKKQCLGNVVYDWFKEKQISLDGIPYIPLESPKDPDDDHVNNPSHYQSYLKDGIDCITAMKHAFGEEPVQHFCITNAFKYIWRHMSKNGMQDIEKAIWYLNKYLELNK